MEMEMEIEIKWKRKRKTKAMESADGHVTFAEVLPSALPGGAGLHCSAIYGAAGFIASSQ
jgi:hypothetical protein